MSQHLYTRSIIAGNGWNLEPTVIAPIVQAALPTKAFVVRASGTDVAIVFEDQLSDPEITVVNDTVAQHQAEAAVRALNSVKAIKIKDIDLKTDQLIGGGFQYASKSFSLSLSAQSKMTGVYAARTHPAVVYPIVWNSIDDMDEYAIVDANDLELFYLTAVGTIRAILDGGTGLKDSVRNATTIAEVNAVEDNR